MGAVTEDGRTGWHGGAVGIWRMEWQGNVSGVTWVDELGTEREWQGNEGQGNGGGAGGRESYGVGRWLGSWP